MQFGCGNLPKFQKLSSYYSENGKGVIVIRDNRVISWHTLEELYEHAVSRGIPILLGGFVDHLNNVYLPNIVMAPFGKICRAKKGILRLLSNTIVKIADPIINWRQYKEIYSITRKYNIFLMLKHTQFSKTTKIYCEFKDIQSASPDELSYLRDSHIWVKNSPTHPIETLNEIGARFGFEVYYENLK